MLFPFWIHILEHDFIYVKKELDGGAHFSKRFPYSTHLRYCADIKFRTLMSSLRKQKEEKEQKRVGKVEEWFLTNSARPCQTCAL